MRPTQHDKLSRAVRSSFQINDAWNYVYERAKNSRHDRTRADAATFAEDETHHLRRLQADLRSGTYRFSPQYGYAKKRGKNKRSRPIVVATVKDRIVQRALLCVCQSTNTKLTRHLGRLPDILATPTSVGGIPGKGAVEATKLISQAIETGAKWYIRTDVRDFFTRISKPSISSFLSKNLSDPTFVELFMGALNVELENEEEVREILGLFPIDETGVAQGSALSALCANIVLHDLDMQSNGRGITTIRYLDDILILGPTKIAVEKVWQSACRILASLGMEAHDPKRGGSKAGQGEVTSGFDFLSLTFRGNAIFPSRKARAHLLATVRTEIARAKTRIDSARKTPRRAQRHFAQSLVLLDLKIRGWGDAFAMTNQRVVFTQLDDALNILLDKYLIWYLVRTRKTPRSSSTSPCGSPCRRETCRSRTH
jgi:RNA-directed DNA polymerase